MAEYAWVWSPGTWPPLLEPATSEWFWIPDGYRNGPSDGRLSAAVSGLLTEWETTPAPDMEGNPPLYAWLHALRPAAMLPRPHIESMPLRYGHDTGVGDLLRLEVTSRWPAGSLAIPDEAREALGDALSCSDMPAESWRYLPWSEDGREACPTGPPWPSAPTVLCRPCGDRPLRSLIVMLGREPLWGAFCDRCCTVYWTRREPVVASVEVDLRPQRGLLPTTVTIGDREVPARVVEVTDEPPGDLYDRTDFERELAVAAARERIARGEARPEDTDATLFWSRAEPWC